MNLKTRLEKITNWEYWPSYMFYIPNLPYAFYLAIKARNPVFFTAVNPGIKNSGDGTESKYTTIQLVPEQFRPKSVLATPETSFEEILIKINQNQISYPLIAKPDIGFRGLLVKKIETQQALQEYLSKYKINIIIQEFIDYKNECGIFYHRNPDSEKGIISSITLKKFTSIIGDGISSTKTLISQDKRAKMYLTLFENIYKNKIHNIPKKGETVQLTTIGNHSKGTQFINGNYLISKALHTTFDALNHAIDGWYYGRIDIKYNNIEDLEIGENFKILEINGIIAEPTHIYDKKNNNYFKSLKTIRNHWKHLFTISEINHSKNNIGYKKTTHFIKEILILKRYTKKISEM